MDELIPLKESYFSLRNQSDFKKPYNNNSSYGKSSLRFFAEKIWNKTPNDIKDLNTISKFKVKTKNRTPICQFKLCKVYIKDVGYIENI